MMYCVEVWGGTCDTYVMPLKILQKKAIRLIDSAHYYAHTALIFLKFNILNFDQLYFLKIAMFMYKVMNDVFPDVLSSMFVRNNSIHNYNTRLSKCIHTPFLYNSSSHCSLKMSGLNIWNLLLHHIDCVVEFKTFKYKVKEYLLSENLHEAS